MTVPFYAGISRLVYGISLVLLLWAGGASAASFDCQKASSADEQAICSNDDLSNLDDAMAAAFRQARSAAPKIVRPLSLSLLSERNACGGDVTCLKGAMTKAIGAYKAVILGEEPEPDGIDKDKIYYGSRAGMLVSVVSRKGLDTAHAVISIEHRREDAVAFCRDYVLNVTEKCIADELAVKLGSTLTADCKTGRFTTLFGQTYVFLGRSTGTNSMGNEFVIIDADANTPLDGSMASGYPVALGQFQALCPKRSR